MASELEQFMNLGLQLSQVVERRLGVQHATWVHPQDLAVIGLAVYSGEGQDTKLLYLNPRGHAHEVVSGYKKEALQRFGITPTRLEAIYPDLTGNGDYSKGIVADALRRADHNFNQEEFREFQFMMASLMARYAKMKPDNIGDPNVRLDTLTGSLRFSSGVTHPLVTWPNVVIEYGPGTVGFKKLPAEVSVTPQTILIETNYYINQFLFSGAQSYGMREPQVITRMDGIKSATEEFLSQNPEGVIDLVIMSMVHSAGEEELEAGITNAHRLLKPGGLFAVQAVEQVKEREASASFIKRRIADAFSTRPSTYYELSYADPVNRMLRDVFQAVYTR